MSRNAEANNSNDIVNNAGALIDLDWCFTQLSY